jgi:hypothetical protein
MNSYTPDQNSDKFIEKLNVFEQRHRPFINLIIKPLLTVTLFLAVGYYTMWMSTTYVKQDNFRTYTEKQDEIFKNRFEVTQSKLETIINNQTAFAEQLKSYNQLSSIFQKQLDNLNDKVTYLERQTSVKNSN